MIIGIDPGTTESAFVTLRDGIPVEHGKVLNHALLSQLRKDWDPKTDSIALESVASFGMAVGKEVFETVFWSGIFYEAWAYRGGNTKRVYRREVKLYLCETSKANDSNIRAAIIDRYGGKEAAIGVKARQGPLYGIRSDRWQALAVALTAENQLSQGA